MGRRSLLGSLFGRGRSSAASPDELWLGTGTDGGSAQSRGLQVTIRHHAAGELALPTGRLVACDPGVSAADARPFARRTPVGRVPVELRVAEFEGGDQRVACALVRLGTGAPSTWEPALPEGLDPARHARCSYGVDSATGCFASAEGLAALAATESFEETVADALGDTYVDTWSWANVTTGPDGLNVVAFSPGWGDGSYPTFWGLDGDGEPVVALSDFRVVDSG